MKHLSTSADVTWLLIDGEHESRKSAHALRRLGQRCHCADNRTRALALAAEHRPERVLLEPRLGNDAGLDLLADLRAALPDARIVVVTAYPSISSTVIAIKAGADDYLPKPVTVAELLENFGDTTRARRARAHQRDDETPIMSPRRLQWELIQRVLAGCDGNVSEAARRLSMHRRTLQRTLQRQP